VPRPAGLPKTGGRKKGERRQRLPIYRSGMSGHKGRAKRLIGRADLDSGPHAAIGFQPARYAASGSVIAAVPTAGPTVPPGYRRSLLRFISPIDHPVGGEQRQQLLIR
jgi:hypothetical protein